MHEPSVLDIDRAKTASDSQDHVKAIGHISTIYTERVPTASLSCEDAMLIDSGLCKRGCM